MSECREMLKQLSTSVPPFTPPASHVASELHANMHIKAAKKIC